MIAHLSGTLLAKQATSVILDVGGVGYEVIIPLSTFYEMEEPGARVSLRIYTYVREDTLQLYGFKTARERELFLRLISVNGVGPKLAIAMLSSLTADEIIMAIRTNNLARLTSVPGVGRKTAERLIIELRDKVATLAETVAEAPVAGSPSEDSLREDTLSALLNLGYPKAAAEKAIAQALRDGGELTVQEILRRSLRLLAKA
ncbi:Holliday junction branch migration protein RuvA [Pyrinomonas methylaliphatogenes]|jgi:Holliday junction DNA helicase RuvA|uniref:Holliday junction branch migration complex subunit RuvA n=1 Tax=Pyrinomonas methylaliphatogenes TaxID=454194 RepID=A0A0B6WW17_9BACT|nr:Holliday junction branch migration protein RuvA [Pyrinomonas methylaliphatogenes]MBX5477549.1 Holliday junction branch migration protein RuvA [Pyrinomonas methylaliphatogenes]CDM64469.1 Holliday junction DNA helicase subunit RuvA [Pyrinomonas methylaliphatogenes]